MRLLCLLAGLCLAPLVASGGGDEFYSLEVTDVNGEKRTLSEYKDKVLLIVNVASECGYTDLNYKELVKLQTDFKNNHFSILGFPSNQFGNQEPASPQEIVKFAKDTFDVNFPIFSKVDVLGDEMCDVYKYMYNESAQQPTWNFCKYLLDRNGNVVQFFSEKDSFESIHQSVEYLAHRRTEL